MFWRILRGFFRSGWKSVFLIFLSLLMGSVISASFLTITLEISERISREFRVYGANILMTPKPAQTAGAQASLTVQDLLRVKTLFWRHNILNLVPYFYGRGEVRSAQGTQPVILVGTWFQKSLSLPAGEGIWTVGLQALASWWEVEGRWPGETEADGVLVGSSWVQNLHCKVGDVVELVGSQGSAQVRIVGIVHCASEEQHQIFAPLETLQPLFGKAPDLSRVFISALTHPLDALAQKDPGRMTAGEREKWLCSPYVTTIAKELEEVFPHASVRPIWRVAEAEGKIHDRLQGLFYFLSALTLLASALAVGATISAAVVERRKEIALMKALGASHWQIWSWLTGHALFLALVASLLGYGLAMGLVHWISGVVFDGQAKGVWLLPCCMLMAQAIALLSVWLPFPQVSKISPGELSV